MKRTALLLVLVVACADGMTVLGQQSAPPQPGRQGGPPQPGRQGDAPQGRQGGGRGQARDRAPATGTATISGRVVAADTGRPIRRAEVQATGGGDRPRGVLTDDNGRFELRELPAGRWMVRAAKTGFISQQFGQRTPFTAADAVILTDRQQFSADFALTRGGAITGRVYDEFGDPIAAARVSALRLASTPNGRRLTTAASSSPTDDTGAFRVYGLPAGDYYLAANVTTALTSNGSLVTAEGPVTYAPVYFPGTPDVSTAQRITLRAGEEQSGISMTLAPVRAVRVSGTVIGAGGTPIAAGIALETPPASGVDGLKNANTSANGTFIIPNVAPGTYLLTVTGRVTSPNTPPEVAAQSITIAGEDVTGLTITTARGATISGVITAENGARVETAGIRVTAPPMRTGPGFTPRAQATAAGGFELSGLFGVHSLRFEPLPAGWAIKSVTVNGVDVTDTAMEFRGSDATSARVVLTNRLTEITGTIRSANPVPRGATVLVFPDDPSRWSPVSRYVRTARAGETGQFTVRGLPPATRYLAIALDYLENGEQLDPEFLQRVKVRAAGFSLADAEKKTVDLDLVQR